MKHKFSWRSYWDKTPKIFRKVGDSLLGVALFAEAGKAIGDAMNWSIVSVLSDKEVHWIAVGAVVGKFLSNFFKEEKKPD